jgi:predicted O-methyltransferase YrrM
VARLTPRRSTAEDRPATRGVPSSTLLRDQIRVLEIAEGFFGSQVLFVLNELGVFDRLAHEPLAAPDVAEALKVDPDATERLLNAGVAAKLLTFREGRYSNSPVTARVLVDRGPGYLGNWLRWMAHLSRAWTRLSDSVRSGSPVVDSARFLGGDEEFTRDFVLAMEDYARVRGAEVVRYLDLRDARRLVDVGGASGAYAIMFASTWPELHVTVFDLPEVVAMARDRIAASGLDNRITTVAGDYHLDEVGEGYDVVFLSDVLHQEDPRGAEDVLGKCYRALRPGGTIVVQGMFLNEDRVSPRWPVMHSLILLLVYGGGRAYSRGETVQLLERAGFQGPQHQRMSLGNVNSLLIARRP